MSSLFTPEQLERVTESMKEYLASRRKDGLTEIEYHEELNRNRTDIIENQLKPLLKNYLEGKISFEYFKTNNDSVNKRNRIMWGFSGIKGQMFFNLLVKAADDLAECDQEIKTAIEVPVNEQIAISRIKTFNSYVKRIGEQLVESGGSKHARPKPSSIPFFLSYFWQIQRSDVWPIYYTSSANLMTDMNLMQPTGEMAEDYIVFKNIHEELAILFTKESGRKFGLYDVEHVFWFKGGDVWGEVKVPKEHEAGVSVNEPIAEQQIDIRRLPESYIPPIVSILPRMARHDEAVTEAAKVSGTSIERAFEKNINAAFSVLGYETKLLGQGKGKVPDGLAQSIDDSYAILWDAKVRKDGYSMGTDDRTIREYITTQSRELKRRRRLRNIYYMLISSSFIDDYDDAIRSLKMETDVSEICLMEASAFVAMVDAKMRDPFAVMLGPDGLQRLFSTSGILTADSVRENLIQ